MTRRLLMLPVGAVALAAALVSSTYGAQAAAPTGPSHAGRTQATHATYRFEAPAPHKYGANGMRMGLHCETTDTS